MARETWVSLPMPFVVATVRGVRQDEDGGCRNVRGLDRVGLGLAVVEERKSDDEMTKEGRGKAERESNGERRKG